MPRRLRIARNLDEESLRRLATAVRPGSGTSVELVYGDGRRTRIACGADEADLRSLLAAVEPDSDCWLELTFEED